ncbi:helix-turn-helix domain-containing protein [Streptomyces sp. NPDC045431]|uniref:helix-turn-helix domain-containing protein n=1 Tax=Streptomyces sp. NPDC045431 TaxID=3155613 RepID=UPI0033F8FB5C
MVKQERARRTRERALDAAAQEFAAHGYAHTTVNAVAARLGMTKGALYGHFASKDELAEAILQYGDAAWQRILASPPAERGPAVPGRPPVGEPLAPLGTVTLALARGLADDVRFRAAYRLAADALLAGEREGRLLLDIQSHMSRLVGVAQEAGAVALRCSSTVIAEVLLALVAAVRSATLAAAGVDAVAWLEAVWGAVGGVLADGRLPEELLEGHRPAVVPPNGAVTEAG